MNAHCFCICIDFRLPDPSFTTKFICGIVYISFRFYQFCFTIFWNCYSMHPCSGLWCPLERLSLYHYEVSPGISSSTACLRPALSDDPTATAALWASAFSWRTFYSYFTFKQSLPLYLKCLPCKQDVVWFFF